MDNENVWWTCGSTKVEHRKSGRTGTLLNFTGKKTMERCHVRWDDDGKEQWIRRKQLKKVSRG